MDLKSYAKSKKTPFPEEKEILGSEQDAALKQKAEDLSKKSEQELMTELMSEIRKGKAEGSFSAAHLEEFIGSVSPMLSSSQRARLEELSRKLKDQL